MIKTVSRMVEEVRLGTNQNVDVSSLPTNYEINKLDDAQDNVCDKLLVTDPYILATYFDLTLDGSWRYYIPDETPYDYENILMVADVTDNTTNPYITMATAWHDRLSVIDKPFLANKEPWNIIDNNIEFPNQPTSGTMRVWYTRRPVGFFYGTVGAGNTSTTVVFPATPTAGELIPKDDWYNGMKVYCAGQVRRITDYDRASATATITPAWTTTPTDSTTTVELISPLPDRYHKNIINDAIRIIKLVLDDDVINISRAIDEDDERMKGRMATRQKQSPEYIRHISRE